MSTDYVTAEDLYLSIRTDGKMYQACCAAARRKGPQARYTAFKTIVATGWRNYRNEVNHEGVIHSDAMVQAAYLLESDMVQHVAELDQQK